MTSDTVIDINRNRGRQRPAGAGLPAHQGVTSIAQAVSAAPDTAAPVAGPSWESECVCPDPCARDHERD